MNAKKTKALRRIVRNAINGGFKTAANFEIQSWATGATDKQISRAFDVVLGTRNFRYSSPYMQAA